MLENEKIDDDYGDRRIHLACRPHDVSSAWIVAAFLGLGLVLAFGAVSLPVGKEIPKAVAASGSNDSAPLAEQIGMLAERAR
jgi:hypothetical protein